MAQLRRLIIIVIVIIMIAIMIIVIMIIVIIIIATIMVIIIVIIDIIIIIIIILIIIIAVVDGLGFSRSTVGAWLTLSVPVTGFRRGHFWLGFYPERLKVKSSGCCGRAR